MNEREELNFLINTLLLALSTIRRIARDVEWCVNEREMKAGNFNVWS